jgi:tRNA U34 5-carboxymethylaminomethyl modifying GTPase MnmE/TrmE
VQSAAVHTDLPEGLSDHRFVRAGDDLGIEEVAVPDPNTESRVVVLAEAAAGLEGALAVDAPELVAASLRTALDRLGEVAGAIPPDDVLGRLFAGFCIGK